MILGSGSGWASRFSSIDERLLTRIAAVWPRLISLLPGQPDEDTITINLVELLFKDAEARSLCHWIEYQFEPVGIDDHGAKFSKGKIDIAVFLDQDRGQYLAFECKRLNVIYATGRQSLATAYVTEGLMRFVSEQYAETLNLGYMLGYVLDGDMVFCMQRLQGAVRGHGPVNLAAVIEAMTPIAGLPRFRTVHSRTGGDPIEVRHALLSHILAAEPA